MGMFKLIGVVSLAMVSLWVAGASHSAQAQTALQAMAEIRATDRQIADICRLPPMQRGAPAISTRAGRLWDRRNDLLRQLPQSLQVRMERLSPVKSACRIYAEQAGPGVPSKKKGLRRAKFKNGDGPAARNGDLIEDVVRTHVRTASRGPAAPNGKAKTKGTPTTDDIKPFFPWPPPQASARTVFRPGVLEIAVSPPTLGHAADRLMEALRRGGMTSFGFFLAPNGFALVTRDETIDAETGKPLAGAARWWSSESSTGKISWSDLFTGRRPAGRYRIFVFALTTDHSTAGPTSPRATLPLAREWESLGYPFLPEEVRRGPLTDGHHLIVHVYEFAHERGGQSRLVDPSQFGADEHLRHSGIEIERRR